MADADLLVLIDTPRALSSRWVREELARAQALGLGVLQLVWPAYARTPGTEFCEPRYLDTTDLEGGTADAPAGARLREAALQAIVSMAKTPRPCIGRTPREDCRRDLDSRDCCRHDGEHPAGPLRGSGVGWRALPRVPIVGHPDSIELFRCFEACGTPPADGVLLYDPLGMLDPKRLHLGWLNEFLPLKAAPVTELDEWFRHL